MSKSRSVGGSLRETAEDSDMEGSPKKRKAESGKRKWTGVQLEKKREQSSRKFRRRGLILWAGVGASDGAAENSGAGNLFFESNQNGLVWSILRAVILGGRWQFQAELWHGSNCFLFLS